MGVIKRQGIKNTISSYVGILLGFVSLILIQPRFLKPEEIGLARVLFAFSTLIASFIPMGVANMAIKYFPVFRNEEKGHHGFLGFMLLFPVLGFVLSAAGLLIFREFIIAQYRRESALFITYYYYIFPFSLFIGFSTVISTYLLSLFKTTVPSYLNDVYVRIAYIAIILLYHFGVISLSQFIGGYVGIYALQLVLMVGYLWRVDRPTLQIDWPFFKLKGLHEMITFGLMMTLTSVAALGLKTVDSIVLGKFGLNLVGIYVIAAFIPTIIEAPLNALDRIVTARVAHAIALGNITEVRDVFYKSVRYLSVIGALLFVGINTNIQFLLNLVGKDYTEGLHVVWIISLGSLINMMGGANNSILVYSSKHWQVALLVLALVLLTFASNMLLIPLFGMNGAAMSTAASVAMYTLLRLFLVYRKFRFQPFDASTLKIVVVILICVGIHLLLPVWHSDILNILFRSAVVGGTFILGVYILRILPEMEAYLPWKKS